MLTPLRHCQETQLRVSPNRGGRFFRESAYNRRTMSGFCSIRSDFRIPARLSDDKLSHDQGQPRRYR